MGVDHVSELDECLVGKGVVVDVLRTVCEVVNDRTVLVDDDFLTLRYGNRCAVYGSVLVYTDRLDCTFEAADPRVLDAIDRINESIEDCTFNLNYNHNKLYYHYLLNSWILRILYYLYLRNN